MVFYKAQQSNPGFELLSQLIIAFLLSNQESGFSNLGFKTQVFNSQYQTQTDISFFRFSDFKPKNGRSRFTLKSPTSEKFSLKVGIDLDGTIVCISRKSYSSHKINYENFSLYVGNDEPHFCARSLDDLSKVVPTMMPLVQKLQTTSEKVTLKVGIDLDGTIVRIDGSIDPKTIFNAMARNGISLDVKLNDKFDDVSII